MFSGSESKTYLAVDDERRGKTEAYRSGVEKQKASEAGNNSVPMTSIQRCLMFDMPGTTMNHSAVTVVSQQRALGCRGMHSEAVLPTLKLQDSRTSRSLVELRRRRLHSTDVCQLINGKCNETRAEAHYFQPS